MATETWRTPVGRARSKVRRLELDLRVAGTLTFLAGAAILLAIITAEALYPATYSTGANEISDLGGTRPPDSVILQPSASIFNGAMLVVGVLVLIGSWYVHRAFGRRSLTVAMFVLGFSALGVGLFPGNTGTPHALFAMATFVSGGIAALCAGVVTGGMFRILSIALGAVSLVTLGSFMLLGGASPMAAMGTGGIERWIVYPIVIWLIAFGAYQLGAAEAAVTTEHTKRPASGAGRDRSSGDGDRLTPVA